MTHLDGIEIGKSAEQETLSDSTRASDEQDVPTMHCEAKIRKDGSVSYCPLQVAHFQHGAVGHLVGCRKSILHSCLLMMGCVLLIISQQFGLRWDHTL